MSARNRVRRFVQGLYARWIRPHISREIDRKRLKLVTWDMWGYRRLSGMRALSPGQKLRVIKRFLAIDWNVPHAHKPSEIAEVCRALAERPARPGECMVEAGCWQGGSSAKFSVVFSQDFHIGPVRKLLESSEPWTEFGRGTPEVTPVIRNLARIQFPRATAL